MLRRRNQSPERVAEIDREILATFQRRLAILVLDMCGFSRLTAKHGPLFYLSMIVQMEEAATPAVLNNGGRVIKQEADNFFAVFDAAGQALEQQLRPVEPAHFGQAFQAHQLRPQPLVQLGQ